jgi:uncharacterized protein (DUF169 family)
MIDLKTAAEHLQTYLRPQTFPVAIRMAKPGEALPERTRRPAGDFGVRFANCQAISMVRRYGWTLALSPEDSQCAPGMLGLGFGPETPPLQAGQLCQGMYTETAEAGARSEAAVDRLPPGAYQALLLAPLERCAFEPHLVCVYGNPAQIMRLVQAALWKRGGKLTSSFGGRIDCAEIIGTTLRTNECQVILPCSGDRIFGQTQDHEMAFTIPLHRLAEVCEGLRGTHRGGIRYPITSFLEYQAKLPPAYVELRRQLEVDGKPTSAA